ncbi:hypothetical protein T12_5206 [Trichinella patagoniensis]|uniref:Uncharacterized protein n=1 Tax=Trichinella patagoniensis TaxID=990121 RepID=A0A0V0Z8X5_9BILA|nr:hypothetical protein T12_5206 [Trichinella patagoniensis]
MCRRIPVHYQLGILNFYPSRSYGIYEFDVAEDDSSTSPPRMSGRFLYNGHPVAYQITATGEQVTSCYSIGNGPRPSRTPLALGFWYSTHCSCIPYDFGISEDDSAWDSEFLSQSLIWHLRKTKRRKTKATVGRIGHEDRRRITVVVVLTCVRWSWQVEGSVFGLSSSSESANRKCGKEMRRSIPACRQIATDAPIIWWKKRTGILEEAARYKFNIAEDDSTTSPPRMSGRFLYNGHPVAYQITATGEQVTSCYSIGNGPRPSRTPLALGFWYSTHCSCITYEFGISEDDSGT